MPSPPDSPAPSGLTRSAAASNSNPDSLVDFLVTKHGLAKALQSDSDGFEALHTWFLDRLVPVCAHLLDAAADAGEIRRGTDAYELMRGIGNLCIGRDSDPRYDPPPPGRPAPGRTTATAGVRMDG